MNILLIGGTGFLGSRITKRLIRREKSVYVLSRNTQKEMRFDKSKVSLVQGDIGNLEFIKDLPSKLDMIVYVAMPGFKPGRISERKFQELKKLTSLYFENTIKLAKLMGATLILTAGASYATRNGEIADETWPITRRGMAALGQPYDELVQKIKCENSVDLIEMLPAQIYGNGGLFSRMINMAKSGRVFIFGSGNNYLPKIHVDDCADAYVLAIEKKPVGQRFIICDDVPCTVKEFMAYLAKIFKVKRILHIPPFILRIVTGKYIYGTITMNTVVTNRHIKEVLGWKPYYKSYKEGLNSLLLDS